MLGRGGGGQTSDDSAIDPADAVYAGAIAAAPRPQSALCAAHELQVLRIVTLHFYGTRRNHSPA